MYAEYAKDPRMKLNVGIRRRLAPLVDNDRRVAELFHAMLFSLPGSPILYYGDEIGMGDNIYLGDRDGVRTPMQWTPDRNAGFSKADFAQLYLPPLMDPVYGYQAVNVEAELRDPSSFLHWIQRMLEVRKQHPVFGVGSFEVLSAENPSVLAFVRADCGTTETSSCASTTSAASPSRSSSSWRASRARRRSSSSAGSRSPGSASCPTCSPSAATASTGSSWWTMSGRPVSARVRADRRRRAAPPPAPAALVRRHRRARRRSRWSTPRCCATAGPGWPASSSTPTGSATRWSSACGPRASSSTSCGARTTPSSATSTPTRARPPPTTRPSIPSWAPPGLAGRRRRRVGRAGAAHRRRAVEHLAGLRRAPDPQGVPAAAAGSEPRGRGHVRPHPGRLPVGGRGPGHRERPRLRPRPPAALPGRRGRRVGPGPDVAPRPLRRDDTQSMPIIDLSAPPPALDPAEAGGDFAAEAHRLGETTAAMHLALAEAFGAQAGDAGAWADDIEGQARRSLPDVVAALVPSTDGLRNADPGAAIRVHGDYHLGQVLRTDAGWFVLDFEGEPAVPEERQRPVVAAARRGRHAAVVPLRVGGRPHRARRRGVQQPGERGRPATARPSSTGTSRPQSRAASCPATRRRSTPSWPRSSWRRRCTSCPTNGPTGRTGTTSRFRPSAAWGRASDEQAPRPQAGARGGRGRPRPPDFAGGGRTRQPG